MPSLGEDYKEECERLEQQLEQARRELRATKEQKAASDRIAEEFDSEVTQLQEQLLELRKELAIEKEQHGFATAKQADLEGQLESAQAENDELAAKNAALQHELQQQPSVSSAQSLLEDSRVPQLCAELEELKAKQEELEAALANTNEHLCEAIVEKEQLQKRLSEARDDCERATDATNHYRRDAEMHKTRVTELETRLAELQRHPVATRGNSMFAEVMDSRTQLEKDVLTLFKEKEELARKLAAATKLAQVNVGGHCACRSGYCDGPTLDAFKLAQHSVSNYRSQVYALETKVAQLETQLNAKNNAHPKPRFAQALQETFEAEKAQLTMRIRLLETENDKLMSAAIYEKGRSESAKRLELEVQRLKELVEHFRFEAQSPEDKAVHSADVAEWMRKTDPKEALDKTQAHAEPPTPRSPEVSFEVRMRQKYEAQKKQQQEAATAAQNTRADGPASPRRQHVSVSHPRLFVPKPKQ